MKKFSKLALIISLFFLSPTSSQARILEKIYAVVNGEIITLSEINDYKKKLKTGGLLNDLLFSDPKERKKALENRDYLIKLLVDEKLIDYQVKQNSLLITSERVSKEISGIAKKQGLSVSQLKGVLKKQGVRFAEYQNFIKKSIERKQLVEKEITSKIKISEQDIVSHYLSKNKTNGAQIFEYTLSHILLKENQNDLAKKVSIEVKEKSNFNALVKKYSTDEDSRNKQGQFGDFKSGEMISSIEKAIQKLNIGETSVVVSTPMGLHIFKINDKKLVKDPQIDRQKQQIYQSLFAKEFKEQLDFWLIQQRKDAIIQINKS